MMGQFQIDIGFNLTFFERLSLIFLLHVLSGHCLQRGGGFAWLRLPLNFLRGSNLLICTALSAGVLPQSRKTARGCCTTFFLA